MSHPVLNVPQEACDISLQALATCLKVLQTLADRPHLCQGSDPVGTQVRHQATNLLRALKRQQRQETKERDRHLIQATRIQGWIGHDTSCP
jgi:hypothetical protein